MKYKVGDKVRVKSKEWYDKNKDRNGRVNINYSFVEKMSNWCGKEVTIDAIYDDIYKIKEDENLYNWTDTMFEDGVVEQTEQHKFKCKDEVIVRLKDPECRWFYGVVSHSKNKYIVLSCGLEYPYDRYEVLPYEGNEHLVGTNGTSESEEVRLEKGELVYGFDDIAELEDVNLILGKFRGIADSSLLVNDCSFTYCIPFSKFNHDDLETMKKEILIVKNGKLVKANVE